MPHVSVRGVGNAVAPQDVGVPAQVQRAQVAVPAGSTIAPDGTVTVSKNTNADFVQASSGTINEAVAKHRIDKEEEGMLAKNRMLIGAGLILLGVVFGFVVPEVFRWPLAATIGLAGPGLILVLLPQPPTWLLILLGGVGAAFAASHYIHKNKTP